MQPGPRDPPQLPTRPLWGPSCVYTDRAPWRAYEGYPFKSPAACVPLDTLPPLPEPGRIHTDPEANRVRLSPPRSLASYLQRKVETFLRGRRRTGSVSSGSEAAGLVHGWGGRPRSAHAGAQPPPPAILVQHRGRGQRLTCR